MIRAPTAHVEGRAVDTPISLDAFRVVAFDLDDTLAVSKQRIDPSMADLLGQLLRRTAVCIISGGRFEQFDQQVLRELTLDEAQRGRLHLMPTCGTRYYRWDGQGWQQEYAEDFTPAERARIIAVLTEGARSLGLWQEPAWGERIEDRGSQVTFSALGQEAPPAEKYGWDPDGAKRRLLCAYASERLPGLEVRGGGSTSVDVTRAGIDKAYGMAKLATALHLGLTDILFIGDRLDEGGNDYPVRKLGIRCIAVQRWEDTAKLLGDLLA